MIKAGLYSEFPAFNASKNFFSELECLFKELTSYFFYPKLSSLE